MMGPLPQEVLLRKAWAPPRHGGLGAYGMMGEGVERPVVYWFREAPQRCG